MKFTCLRENLLKTLNSASKVVPIKNTLPILSQILIKVENNTVTIYATNLESALAVNLPASVETEGSVTVSLKLLRDAITHVTSQSLIIELEGDGLSIVSPKSKASFMTMPTADFPAIPQKETAASFIDVNTSELFNAITLVAFSCATDEAKPVYTGVLIHFKDNILTLATTDGFRLSEKKINVASDIEEFSAIVPAKTFLEIVRIMTNSPSTSRLYLNSNRNLLFLENDESFVATGIIDGNFPDYKRIVPTETDHMAQVLLKDVLEAVKLASVFTKEDSDAVRLVIDPVGQLHVKSSSQETGVSSSVLEAVVTSSIQPGDSPSVIEVAFNPRYLLDIFNNLKCEKISIETASVTSPCLIRPLDGTNYIHIVMPVRLNS